MCIKCAAVKAAAEVERFPLHGVLQAENVPVSPNCACSSMVLSCDAISRQRKALRQGWSPRQAGNATRP
jgi:hypothetical protein